MNIQEYLLIKDIFNSYQINYKLKKTLIAFLSNVISIFICFIIKTTILISNILINNFFKSHQLLLQLTFFIFTLQKKNLYSYPLSC